MSGNDAKTVLLIHSDTTNGSTIFEDSSVGSEPFTLTGHNFIDHDTGAQVFGATSIAIGGYRSLEVSRNAGVGDSLALDGDFTIDFWLKSYGDSGSLWGEYIENDIVGLQIYLVESSYKVYVVARERPYGVTLSADAALLSQGSWYHVALVRLGDTLTIYIGGIKIASAIKTGTFIQGDSLTLFNYYVGAYGSPQGYVDEFRVSQMARWKTDFTPPPRAYEVVLGPGNNANTLLLIHSNDVDNSTVFTDSAVGGTTHVASAFGSAKHYSTQAMFGASSILLDGSGDAIQVAQSTDFAFGTNDFTIDFWEFPITTFATSAILFQGGLQTEGAVVLETVNTTSHFYFIVKSNGNTIISQAGVNTYSYDNWYHVAIVRESNQLTLYINGIASGTALFSTTLTSSSDLGIGGELEATAVNFKGYLDEFRISNIAVWSNDFIPDSFAYDVLTADLSVGIGLQTEIVARSIITATNTVNIGLHSSLVVPSPILLSAGGQIGLDISVSAKGLQPIQLPVNIGISTAIKCTSTRDADLAVGIGLKTTVKGIAYDPPYPTELAVTIGLGAELDASYKDKLADISCNIGLGSTLRVLKLPEAELSTGIGLHAVCEADIGKALFVTCGIGLASSILAKADRPFTIECAVGLGSTVSMVKDADTSLPVLIGLGSNVKISSDAVQQSCTLPEFEDRWI